MKKIILSAIFALSFVTSFKFCVAQESTEKLFQDSKVSYEGIGSIHFGMTIDEASKVLGKKMKFLQDWGEEGPESGCNYIAAEGDTSGIAFMVIGKKIVRVDVEEPSTKVTTVSGAHIGMSESEAQKIYNNNLRVEHHAYEEGHYLISTPGEMDKSKYGIVFETNGSTVTRYRAGLAPYAFYVEGCS